MSRLIFDSVMLHDFKGTSEATYYFNPGINVVYGPNGSGKTTFGDAVNYGMTGKDYSMTTNPAIAPNNKDADTAETLVNIKGRVDGKPIEIIRSQKTRFSKPDANGVRKVTTVNTYSINSVTMSERDAVKRFAEYGIDMELYPIISHPLVFVGQAMGDKKAKDKARPVIFSMASPIPDVEIVKQINAPELAELLENYTLDEVSAMQRATRRKVTDNYGKKGEILNAKITALEGTIVRIDAEALEQRKAELEQRKATLMAEMQAVEDKANRKMALINTKTALFNELSTLINNANMGIAQKRKELNASILKANNDVSSITKEGLYLSHDRTVRQTRLGEAVRTLEGFQAELRNAEGLEFDESTLACPTCGRKYPANKQDEIRKQFYEKKAARIVELTNSVKSEEAYVAEIRAGIDEINNEIASKQDDYRKAKKTADALQAELDALPGYADDIDTDEANTIKAKIANIDAEIQSINDVGSTYSIRTMIDNVSAELERIGTSMAKIDNNKDIEDRIEAYRKQQTDYEQMLADTEMIDDQIAQFGRKKNELLTESINKHFALVSWKLFDYQKNGEYKECLIPMIGNTPYDSLSGGEKLRAMVDIVVSLQKWYDIFVPVIVDEAGIATEETLDVIKNLVGDTQLILLIAKDTEGGKVVVESI